MIIVDNLKGLKKIKYDLANMDLPVIDKMSSGDNVFGFNYKGDYYIGRVVMQVDSHDSLVLKTISSIRRGRGEIDSIIKSLDQSPLSYRYFTTNHKLTAEIIKVLPLELLDDLDTIEKDIDFDKNLKEAIKVFEKYKYSIQDIIDLYIQPLNDGDRNSALADIIENAMHGSILVEIAMYRRNRNDLKIHDETNFMRRFKNDYIYDNKMEVLEMHSLFEAYAYKVVDGEISKTMIQIDGCKLSDINLEVWYYPQLKVVDPYRNNYFSYIACTDYLYGVDIWDRESPTAIVGDEYIIGKDCSSHESHHKIKDIRYSAIHSGLVFSYLLQRNTSLGENGHFRTTLEKILDDAEYEGILFGEVYNGHHSIYTTSSKLESDLSDQEILDKFKSIMKVEAVINLVISDKVIRCNAKGEPERFIEIILREDKYADNDEIPE